MTGVDVAHGLWADKMCGRHSFGFFGFRHDSG